MHIIIGIAVAILAGMWWNAESPGAFSRLWDHETRLGVFEYRIGSPADEMMRRIPGLEQNFADFRACARERGCDVNRFLATRDELIRTYWPEVFDRLLVKKDWGNAASSNYMRDRFFAAVEKYGEKTLRDVCAPTLMYSKGGDRTVTDYCPQRAQKPTARDDDSRAAHFSLSSG